MKLFNNFIIFREGYLPILLAMLCLTVLTSCSRETNESQAQATDTQNNLTPAEVRAIAKDAYLFTYPLVMNYRTMYMQALDPKSGVGLGNWLHLGMSTPDDKTIVSPNNDTPYSYAWLDLRAEPWVLTMPKIEEKRFYTSQWDDIWGFIPGNAGSVDDGNDGVSVILASPSWNEKLPAGINRAIQGETDIMGTLTRTQAFGLDDLPAVKTILKQYNLQPLSAFLGKPAAKAAPAVNWPKWVEGANKNDAFWPYVNFLLSFTTPNAADRAIIERMAKIGVAPGADWAPGDMSDAIQAGLDDALKELKQKSKTLTDASKIFGPRELIKTDYFSRSLGVYMGIFANTANISTYYTFLKDSDGDLLDGSKHNYTLRFEAGQTPPVKNFWSLTLYSVPPASFLVDNPIDRYSIGSPTPGLKKADDGSLTLYFSVKSPGKDKESNWLPSPEAQFWMPMRLYGPGKAILDKSWKMPSIKKVD